MTPEQQRIAIAEWCGWKWGKPVFQHDGKWHSIPHTDTKFDLGLQIDSSWAGTPHDVVRDDWMLPDYLNDLNAMHEAEGKLPETRRGYYNAELSKISANRNLSSAVKEPQFIFDCIHARAAQRAEALLRAIGKWENSEMKGGQP